MKIEMLIQVAGTFEGIIDGVNPGDIVEVPDERAASYCAQRYARPVVDRKEERAVAPKAEERAQEPESDAGADAKPEPGLPKPGARPTRK